VSVKVKVQAEAWLLMALLVVAVAAPLIAPHDPNATLDIVALKSQAPSLAHPFGTDPYSRDVLSRVLHGTRVSLGFALATVVFTLGIGTAYGAAMAFSPAMLGVVLQRLLDVAFSVPRLLVLLAVTGVAGPLSIGVLVALMAGTGWFTTARLVHDEIVALRSREFVLAARASGVPARRLMQRHLLPHLVPLLMTAAAFSIAGTIMLEAGLSYLGLGIQPPTASWGNIIRDGAGLIQTHWWLTVFPTLATVLPVMACNAVGDALRDRFAPPQFAGSATPAPSQSSRARVSSVLRP
jgi:peptide/nickel transport system permease protein